LYCFVEAANLASECDTQSPRDVIGRDRVCDSRIECVQGLGLSEHLQRQQIADQVSDQRRANAWLIALGAATFVMATMGVIVSLLR